MATGRKSKGKDRDALAPFADELKAHRAALGWTQADVAAKTSYSESLISQVEACWKPGTPDLAKALDRLFKTPGFTEATDDGPGTPGTFGRIVVRLRNLPFPASFRSFAPYEAEAAVLRTFEHSLVPGLLQTPEYARAVLATLPNTSDDDIDALVAARLGRQAVLQREDPPIVWVLMDEWAVRRPVGPPDLMRAQRAHLVEISRLPNVTIQVVPYSAGGHVGLQGAFTIADLEDSGAILYLETAADGQTIEDTAIVSQVSLRFDSLRAEALPKKATRELLEQDE
jgi:hypothetical protein